MKKGIVWGRTHAITKRQWNMLKNALGQRLRDVSMDCKIAYYAVINDEYEYTPLEEDKLFFVLCAEALVNRFDVSKDKEFVEIDESDEDQARGKYGKGVNFESYLRRLYYSKDLSDSTKQRIVSLCSEKFSYNGRMQRQMSDFLWMMQREKIRMLLNTVKLEKDLLAWEIPSEPVQRSWAKRIVKRIPLEKISDVETTGNPTENGS